MKASESVNAGILLRCSSGAMALAQGMRLAAAACVVVCTRSVGAATSTAVVPSFTTDRASFNNTGEGNTDSGDISNHARHNRTNNTTRTRYCCFFPRRWRLKKAMHLHDDGLATLVLVARINLLCTFTRARTHTHTNSLSRSASPPLLAHIFPSPLGLLLPLLSSCSIQRRRGSSSARSWHFSRLFTHGGCLARRRVSALAPK
jgi:hypothetical protein